MYSEVYFVFRSEKEKVFQSQVLTLLNLLKKSGKNQTLLVLVKNLNSDNARITELLKKYNLEKECLIYEFGYLDFLIRPGKTFKKIAEDIKKKLNMDMPVLFHCRQHVATFIAIKVKSKTKLSKIKVLYDNRGIIEENLKTDLINKIKNMFHRKIFMFSQKYCDAYSFVSSEMRNFCISRYDYSLEKPFIIIPTCVNKEDIPEQNTVEHKFNYIYIGTTYFWQNIEQTIKVLSEMQKLDNESKVVMLVDQPDVVKTLCAEYSLDALVNEVEHKEVMGYLVGSTAGILLRDKSIINKVAAPTKLSEYVSCGIRVIYSGDMGSLNDFIEYENLQEEKDEFLFNLDNLTIEEIVVKLKETSYKNRQFTYFLWQTHIGKYEKLLESML